MDKRFKNKAIIKFTSEFDFGLTFLFVEITARVTVDEQGVKIEILEIYSSILKMVIDSKLIEDNTRKNIETIIILLTRSQ